MKDSDFKRITEQYYEDIYKLAFLLTKNRDDAADITQETFLRVKKYLKSFRGDSSVKTWLYRIATNEAKRLFKKRETEKHIKIPTIKQNDAEDARYERLKEAMERIDRESYEILYLRYFKNMSEKEIAFVLNIPCGTVKSRLYTAKEKLKKEMENE